ncbi:MAG: sigma 54-interacting transcriptional regulator [Oscillospiraceae bacterium]
MGQEKFECPGCANVSEEEYRSVLDAIFCGIIILDGSGRVSRYNDAAIEAFGVLDAQRGETPEECIRAFCELLGELVDLVRGSGRYQIDMDDRRFVCNVNAWQSEGTRIGTIIIFHESMHSNCIVQEMDVTNNLLQEINIFVESSHDGILVTDNHGMVIRVNAAFERVFSVARRDVLGRMVPELIAEGLFPQSAALKVLETQETATVVMDKGNQKIIATGTPAFDDCGVFTSVVVNIRDITELNNLRFNLDQQRMVSEGYVRELTFISNQKKNNDVVACSKEMQTIMDTIKAISGVDSTVLITGESGTGKEVIVNQIYKTSSRNTKPIIKINCGAIPSSLFESEVFGYEDGAFTGARRKGKAGFFELANEGTLFLDEIGELDTDVQVKLLRVIQEGEITRIGGSKSIHVDVRLIAATNQDLWALTQAGKFRQDLFYRLNVINIEVPPLRQRQDDIIPLAIYFLEKYTLKYHKQKEMSLELGKILRSLDWPGNIRELENLIENMVVLVQDDVLLPHHLPRQYQQSPAYESQVVVKGILPLKVAVEQVEAQLIQHAQDKYTTTREIAQALGVNQSTISRKLAQFLHH